MGPCNEKGFTFIIPKATEFCFTAFNKSRCIYFANFAEYQSVRWNWPLAICVGGRRYVMYAVHAKYSFRLERGHSSALIYFVIKFNNCRYPKLYAGHKKILWNKKAWNVLRCAVRLFGMRTPVSSYTHGAQIRGWRPPGRELCLVFSGWAGKNFISCWFCDRLARPFRLFPQTVSRSLN